MVSPLPLETRLLSNERTLHHDRYKTAQKQQQSNKRPNNSSAIDVLIVGAGPTGLIMASELARHGVVCRIIDKSPTKSQVSKALVIQSRTLELFDLMDIVTEFLALGTEIYAVNMYTNGKQLAHLTFDELSYGKNPIGKTLKNLQQV